MRFKRDPCWVITEDKLITITQCTVENSVMQRMRAGESEIDLGGSGPEIKHELESWVENQVHY